HLEIGREGVAARRQIARERRDRRGRDAVVERGGRLDPRIALGEPLRDPGPQPLRADLEPQLRRALVGGVDRARKTQHRAPPQVHRADQVVRLATVRAKRAPEGRRARRGIIARCRRQRPRERERECQRERSHQADWSSAFTRSLVICPECVSIDPRVISSSRSSTSSPFGARCFTNVSRLRAYIWLALAGMSLARLAPGRIVTPWATVGRLGSVHAQLPPFSDARSTITEPAFMPRTAASAMSSGARCPGTSAVVITTSLCASFLPSSARCLW